MVPGIRHVAALVALLCCSHVVSIDSTKTSTNTQPDVKRIADTDADAECSSLTGPFCVHTDSMTFYESYMTPITTSDLQQQGNEVTKRNDDGASDSQRKKCFFQHYSGSWMDSGGDVNDIMNQVVANVDECEQLCCEHKECASFTFWRGRTCFLRAVSQTPRHDDDSFSGIRLI
ncbi:hypothetical protein PHYBOEH_010354 [Phytophthora boehmeriae]|uniref:Apple domain-containing protein n=1 Tax=Phytophthora boehmeriae TaxID=109152 RepID=A0A8T1X5E5_9STRA|nr:hypothetical protein PHYBOEH_010354 [Phytophthora boehmeriae]